MQLLRLLLVFLAASTSPAPAFAPNPAFIEAVDVLSCGTDDVHNTLRRSDPDYALKMDVLEAEWAKRRPEDQVKAATAPPYVLPIVFHIVHENGPENIADADILRSVDFLNQALENTNYYDPATGVNTQIQVCLARRSPDNESTNGINRIVSPLTNLSTNDDRELKDLSRWAPLDYINVWVVKEACGLNLGCGLAGYAYYPGAHGSRIDGIVMEARWLADDEADLTVLVHELGHYLGVRHTFDGGCENDDCLLDGDRVCDTPPDQSTVAVPCTGSANSCSTDTDSGPFTTDQDDMHINYMDYGYFQCYSAFTAGQRERMHFFLEGRRQSLLESRGCEEPCPAVVTAGFTGGNVTIAAGETVNFTNTSTNGASYEWYRGSTLISTDENANYLFDEEGTFRIRLIVTPFNTDLCESVEISQRVRVTCDLDASFDLPTPGPRVDEAVVFTNTSAGANESEWTVDGNVVSTDADLNYVFTAVGTYLVCLTEIAEFCEDQRCVTMFVRMPVIDQPVDTTGCDGRFAYSYSQPEFLSNSWFSAVAAKGDTIYTLAGRDQTAYVMAIRANGTILWQIELFPQSLNADPKRFFMDREGMLAGLLLSGDGMQEQSLVFRIDPENGALLWAKEFSTESGLSLTSIIESRTDSDYRVSGISDNQSFIAQLDRDNGDLILTTQQIAGFGSLLTRDITEVGGAAISGLVMVGNVQQGITLIRTDAAGSVLESNIVSRVSNATGPNSFSPPLLINDGDSLVIGTIAEDMFGNMPYLRICKTGIAGIPRWTKDYRLPTDAAQLNSVRKNDNGYLLLLDSGAGATLIQTDFNGEVLWANQHENFGTLFSGPDALAIEENHILVAGYRFSGNETIPTVIRLSKDGSAINSCVPAFSLDITAQLSTNSNGSLQVSNAGIQLNSEDFGAEPSSFTLVEELSCREDCPDEEDCARPFVRTYGPPTIAPNLAPYEVNLHVENGENIIIAGRDDARIPFIAVLGPDGEILGTRSIISDQPGVVLDMIIDDEGMLCGVGTSGSSANGGLSTYAFRLNPADVQVLWIKNYIRQNRSFVLSELHHTPGDNFLRAAGYREADPSSAISNGLVARIDLATGEILTPPISYSDLGETSFRAFDKHPGTDTYYALANIQQSSAGTPQLARLNADGTVIFNKQYDTPTIGQALDMVVKDEAVTMLCQRNGGGFVLVQTDTDGNQLWQKDYLRGSVIHGITATEDGFVVWIERSEGTGTFIRLDDAGNILWANSTPGISLSGQRNEFHVTSSATAITVSATYQFISANPEYLALLRLSLTGRFGSDCLPEGNTFETPVAEPQTIVADIPLQLDETSFFTEDLGAGETELELKEDCNSDCPEPEELIEICDNGLDDDEDGLADCDDPDLMDDCCCRPPPDLFRLEDDLFCGGLRLIFSAPEDWQSVRVVRFGSGEIARGGSGPAYFFILDQPGTYQIEVLDTCGIPALDTFTLSPYQAPILDLGPDTTVCENATVTLRAQPGFESYEWIDGSTEETFTTSGEGDFSVVATDSCGNQQTDTVSVIFDPATVIDLGDDLVICPGDTLTFTLEGYTDIQWSQSSFIDCFDCTEVRFAPTMDTLLLVAAKQGEGCFSSDSLRVRIKALAGIRDSVFLCPGDSLSFGDQVITVAGQYYDFSDESRCPLIDTLDVFGLRDTLISTDITICAGDSVLIFGAFEREAGTYLIVNPLANGCDSTNQVILTVNQLTVTAETISICAGDSALVFGIFERESDLYSRTATGSNGCDSTHQITLEVNDVTASAVQIRPDCGGAGAGAGQVLFESNGRPVTILWSDNTGTALNENLVSGNYTVTVTTEDGCSASASLTISDAPEIAIAPRAMPESCPGENDGSVSTPESPVGFTYSLNGGPEQSSPLFNNLAPGAYQLIAQDSFGCVQSFDLSVNAANALLFELPLDQSINFGDSVVLAPTLLTPAEATINWLTDNGLGCPSCPEFILRPEETIMVTAIATDSSGCSVTRTVTITVNKDDLFYVPNAFSPNGDGMNDVFRLYPGPAVESILSFAVYDRWGGQVFLRENVNPEDALGHWDGRLMNGSDPSVGLYVYLVEVRLFGGAVISQAGEVLIMR